MKNRQVEIPVNNNSIVTSRSLKNNHPNNLNLYKSSQEFEDLLKEVKIRFDTNPKYYQREDYQKLIELIRKNGGECPGGDIDIEVQGDGSVVTNITSEGNTLNVVKGQARYPRARWARRGFIDLTNCKDIDYIIVPCTSKQQCLYITNDYLKSLRHTETYESIYGQTVEFDENENPIFPEDFWKVISKYWDHFTKATGYILPRLLDLQMLDNDKLPCTSNIELFINIKEFAITKNVEHKDPCPLKLLFNRKDTHNGFIQFPYFKQTQTATADCLLTKFVFTPYMVFANPFNSTLGGVIPVRNGKLILEEATRLRNKTIELVTTGELIHFDEYGICETLLNPYTFIYLTRRSPIYYKGNKLKGSYRKIIINPAKKSLRGGCFIFRRKVRVAHGMYRRCLNISGKESIWNSSLHHGTTTKYQKQIPMIISKNKYTSLKFLYLCSKILIQIDNTTIQKLLFLGDLNKYRVGPYKRRPGTGYLEFSPKNPANLSRKMQRFVRYYKAPYDRMNIYIINRHANIISEELYTNDLRELDSLIQVTV